MIRSILAEHTFTDADEAAAAIRAGDVEFSVLAPSQSAWRVGSHGLAGPMLWWGHVAAASAVFGCTRADVSLLVFGGDDARDWRINGRRLGERDVAVLPPQSNFAYACSTPGSWTLLACPQEWIGSVLEGTAAADLVDGSRVSTVDLGPAAPALRGAIAEARRQVVAGAALGPDAELERGLNEALGEALCRAFGAARAAAPRDPRLVGRVLEYLREHPRTPLVQQDLCRALETSPRTLSRIFPSLFGTSPSEYLRRRRLHLAHRAIASGEPHTVTEAATRLGFYDLGRFAGTYRRLFGESPRQTLLRAHRGAFRT